MTAGQRHWHHAGPVAGRYPCIESTSLVRARCCVEERAVRAPADFAACAPRFHSHPDPWTALRAIHASVLRDVRPARALDHTLLVGRG